MDFKQEFSTFKRNSKFNLSQELTLLKTSAINAEQSLKKKSFENLKCEKEDEDESRSIKNLIDFSAFAEFKLYLHASIDPRICKGKYFSFKVILGQLSEFLYPANEVVELEVVVYNNEQAIVSKNMKGHDILRGNYKQNMHYFKPENKHVAYFRIQITEVSSHFINKTVNLIIRAKKNGFLIKTGWKIQPIVLEGLTVKAKKTSD
jgi:hypothetical protein